MADEKIQSFSPEALNKFRQWHFWWLIVFSFLLIIIFVYYLPTRFLQQVGQPHVMDQGMHNVIDESQPHGHDSSGASMPNTSSMGRMSDDDMHEHMDEHMSMDMGEEDMMTHMMEMHMMTHEESEQIMDEMMGHEHEATVDGEHAGHIPSMYHEEVDIKEGLVVNFNANPVPYNTGTPLRLDFFVNEKPGNVPVRASTLEIEHSKKMHVIGVRSDMNEFFHIHPVSATDEDAVFSINYIFNKPGLYKIWSSIVKEGIGHTFGHPVISINGDGLREEKKITFSRNTTVNNYQVSLKIDDSVVKNKELEFEFDIHTLTGQEIEVEPYLDADMHLAIIKDDWSQFIHTHPIEHQHSVNNNLISTVLADEGHGHGATEGDEVISFSVNFPEAGLYKAFAQFRPRGTNLPADEAITAEFWIQVEEQKSLPFSQWWLLLIVSVILMGILSWIVNRYLKVKTENIAIKK